MTARELLARNFDVIFIESDPDKREHLMREVFTEDCVWVHPGGKLQGIHAINEAATALREPIHAFRYTVVGSIQSMHMTATCRWGSGLPGGPFRYTGTDFLEERDGRVARFYTFLD